jgi:hypothetical protein
MTTKLTTLTARVGKKSLPMHSWEQVSDAYRSTIAALGVGASKAPRCVIVDNAGRVVAHVSYNGRVWAGEAWQPDTKPIFDPIK